MIKKAIETGTMYGPDHSVHEEWLDDLFMETSVEDLLFKGTVPGKEKWRENLNDQFAHSGIDKYLISVSADSKNIGIGRLLYSTAISLPICTENRGKIY